MRIVESGAAGFVGSHFCDCLLTEGHEVIGLDNFLTGSPANLAHLADEPRFQFLKRDITRPFRIAGAVDCVVNMASPASPKDYLDHPIETLDVGSAGTRRMLELACERGARFLLTSTCYDESKRFAEATTMAYHRARGVRTNIARIFNTYGPRMKLNDGRVIPAFLSQALAGEPLTIFGDGSQTRSFCYVSDLVDGLYRVMLCDERLPVNLGNPEEMTVRDFAERIIRLTGSGSRLVFHPLPEDDPKQRRPDISRARALLAWQPKIPLEEGLQRTIAYFREGHARAA